MLFDSTAPYLFLPPSIFNDTLAVILSKNGNPVYNVQNGQVYIECSTTLIVPISFMIQNYWIELLP